jgi:hypothetical protein
VKRKKCLQKELDRPDIVRDVRVKAIESSVVMERAMGIEPTSEAWEA